MRQATPTIEDVRHAILRVLNTRNVNYARRVCVDYGFAEMVSCIDPANYQAVINRADFLSEYVPHDS
jgi:hypothetical protein